MDETFVNNEEMVQPGMQQQQPYTEHYQQPNMQPQYQQPANTQQPNMQPQYQQPYTGHYQQPMYQQPQPMYQQQQYQPQTSNADMRNYTMQGMSGMGGYAEPQQPMNPANINMYDSVHGISAYEMDANVMSTKNEVNSFLMVNGKFTTDALDLIKMSDVADIRDQILSAKNTLNDIINNDGGKKKKKPGFVGGIFNKGKMQIDKVATANTSLNTVLQDIYDMYMSRKDQLVVVADKIKRYEFECVQRLEKLKEYAANVEEQIEVGQSTLNMVDMRELDVLKKNIYMQYNDITENVFNRLVPMYKLSEMLNTIIETSMPVVRNRIENNLACIGTMQDIEATFNAHEEVTKLADEISATNKKKTKELFTNVINKFNTKSHIEVYENNQKDLVEMVKLINEAEVNFHANAIEDGNKLKLIKESTEETIQGIMIENSQRIQALRAPGGMQANRGLGYKQKRF